MARNYSVIVRSKRGSRPDWMGKFERMLTPGNVLLAVGFITILVIVQFVGKSQLNRLKAANGTAKISVLPTTGSASPDVAMQIWITADKPVSFAQVTLTFDQTKLALATAPVLTSTKLVVNPAPLYRTNSAYILPVTTLANANSTGTYVFVLGLDAAQKDAPPTGTFQLANLRFTSLTASPNITTMVGISTAGTSVVDNTSLLFSVTRVGSTVTLNPVAETATLTPKLTPTQTPPSSGGVPCSSLSGIERRFPCSPLVAGPMPEKPKSGTDAWDMFKNSLYPGTSGNGVNERFSAVPNPAGSGVVVRNQNLLSDGENHTTVGTSRDLPLGSTECSAFRWLWKDATEFNPVGWNLIWQLQMSGSPIVAISVNQSTNNWFFKSRNGSDSGLNITLAPVQYGHWAYFVACTHLADAPNGWTKIWFRHDGWPDVNAAPFYQRSGHDTYQGETGHNTIGIYAGNDVAGVSYYGYFDRYGRATTPQRAIQIAGNP